MNAAFVEKMRARFGERFSIAENDGSSYLKFPAACAEFGDIDIYESIIEGLMYVGNFTHDHFDIDDDEDTDDLAELLEKLFADGVICWGSHKGSGGWFVKGNNAEKERAFLKNTDGNDRYVWSGLYKAKATQYGKLAVFIVMVTVIIWAVSLNICIKSTSVVFHPLALYAVVQMFV